MLWTALLLGLAGSLHCAGMCGPLLLALPQAEGGGGAFVSGRLAYHAGRLMTYGVLGILFGLLGRSLVLIGLQRWLSMAAGLLMIAGLGATFSGKLGTPLILWVRSLKSVVGRLLQHRSWGSLTVLGSLNGLLPCGLVYAAGAGATAAGGWVEGLEYMLLFGLGTLPMMLGLSLSGRVLPTAWRLRWPRLVPIALSVVGGLLIFRGLALGIPYLSPDLAGNAAAHCH